MTNGIRELGIVREIIYSCPKCNAKEVVLGVIEGGYFRCYKCKSCNFVDDGYEFEYL